ncbi:MAG: hypothetical protein ACRDHP_20225, partial [Ktedonobacterales bacterium]
MRIPRRSQLAALGLVSVVVALLLVTIAPAVWSRQAQASPASAALACVASPWAVIPTQDTGTTGNQLDSVAGVASNDVWSVGSVLDLNHGTATPIAEHWNGGAW